MAKKQGHESNINGTGQQPAGGAITMMPSMSSDARSVTLVLPVGRSIPTAYKFVHIDGQLNAQQSEALRILFDAMAMEAVLNGAQLPRGGVDAIRFLLDHLYSCYAAAGATENPVEVA